MGRAETEKEEFCTLLMSTIRHPAAEKSSKETEGWLWWHILTVSPLGRQKQGMLGVEDQSPPYTKTWPQAKANRHS